VAVSLKVLLGRGASLNRRWGLCMLLKRKPVCDLKAKFLLRWGSNETINLCENKTKNLFK
jgi:hypothetical protein